MFEGKLVAATPQSPRSTTTRDDNNSNNQKHQHQTCAPIPSSAEALSAPSSCFPSPMTAMCLTPALDPSIADTDPFFSPFSQGRRRLIFVWDRAARLYFVGKHHMGRLEEASLVGQLFLCVFCEQTKNTWHVAMPIADCRAKQRKRSQVAGDACRAKRFFRCSVLHASFKSTFSNRGFNPCSLIRRASSYCT